jgi:hypothetical protein
LPLVLLVLGVIGCGNTLPGGGGGDVVAPPAREVDAEYVGSSACRACHPEIAALHGSHGHSQVVQRPERAAPTYAAAGDRAGVPDPPPPTEWRDIAYVLGGYSKAAHFLDHDGFLITDGDNGQPIQFNLVNFHSGTTAGFVEYDPDRTSTEPFDYACLRCHVTGAKTLAESAGRSQGGLPGIQGRWAEDGVQCEACHGPGSVHVGRRGAARLIVDGSAAGCADCHANPDPAQPLRVSGQFILGYQQVGEVAASPHARSACSVCHNPHASVLFEPERGIRNSCTACHSDIGMAGHAGRVFAQRDHVERLDCTSCHMPYASRHLLSAEPPFASPSGGPIGDVRTHIMSINTDPVDWTAMVTADGRSVAVDNEGRGAVTLDYVCLRCHNGLGSARRLTLETASVIAADMHSAFERDN